MRIQHQPDYSVHLIVVGVIALILALVLLPWSFSMEAWDRHCMPFQYWTSTVPDEPQVPGRVRETE